MRSCMVRCEYLNILWGFIKGYLRIRSFKRSSFLSDLLNFYFSYLFPFFDDINAYFVWVQNVHLFHPNPRPTSLLSVLLTHQIVVYIFCIVQIHHEICKLQRQRRTEGRAAALSPPPLGRSGANRFIFVPNF